MRLGARRALGLGAALLGTLSCETPLTCEVLPSEGGATVSFVALGDTGKGYPEQYQVAEAAREYCAREGCDFGVLLGDNFYDDGVGSVDDPQFMTKYEEPYGAIGIPFYPVLGNHDYGGDGLGYEFARGAYQVDYTSRSETWTMPGECYAYERGPLHMLAMNTPLSVYDVKDATRRQIAFFGSRVRGNTRPWVIAYAHHPFDSSGSHGDAGEYDGGTWPPQRAGQYIAELTRSALCEDVDVYLAGHDHHREVLSSDRCDFLSVVSGASGGARYRGREFKDNTLFHSEDVGFTHFEASESELVIRMLNVIGEVDFEYRLTR